MLRAQGESHATSIGFKWGVCWSLTEVALDDLDPYRSILVYNCPFAETAPRINLLPVVIKEAIVATGSRTGYRNAHEEMEASNRESRAVCRVPGRSERLRRHGLLVEKSGCVAGRWRIRFGS